MEEQTAQTLIKGGIDLETTLKRFMGNEDMFLKYFKLFAEDESILQLESAIDAGDNAAATLAVHTLKGISGNLGMAALYDLCVDMLSRYRDGRENEAESRLPAIRAEYDHVMSLIRSL